LELISKRITTTRVEGNQEIKGRTRKEKERKYQARKVWIK